METEVLIVGAGPAGLTAGVTLARYGVPTLLIDAEPNRDALARATVISTRSMELLRSWGLEEAIRLGAVDVDWLLWVAPTLAEADQGSPVEVGMPTRAQAALISPTEPLAVGQDHLETVLLGHFAAQPTASTLLGVAVTAVAETAAGVRVRLADGRTITAHHVIGADGWRSTVREQLGIAVEGEDDLAAALSVEFTAPLWSILGQHRYGLYATTNPAGLFLPCGAGDRWRYGIEVSSLDGVLADYPPERLAKEIRVASGVPWLQPALGRIGTFRFGTHIADRFRSGNVFLIGDAAHRVTPRGGTGMNLAIHDGFDLGWRMAFVFNDWAGAGLLDGYETTRRPIAEHNLARSADPSGSRRTAREGLDADLGGRVRHLWLAPGRSTVDVLGPGLTQFVAPDPGGLDALDGVRIPVTTVALDAFAAQAIGVPPGGRLLVGPDGRPWR